MKRHVWLIALIVLLCGCSPPLLAPRPQPGPAPTPEPPPLSEEDQIREVVFRYQFEFNASGQKQEANFYFLQVEDNADPSPLLLERFAGHSPPVLPASASTLEPGTTLVLDRETGQPGLIFRIDEIRWLNEDEVEADGGYEEASESGSGNTYLVARKGGGWEVVGVEMLFIK